MSRRRRFWVNGTGTGLVTHGSGTGERQAADSPRMGEGQVFPYGRGWQAPWRGTWGPMGDWHSKLGRLASREEGQLAQLYPGADPLGLRREAAELRAIAKMLRSQIGFDPRVTIRKVTALEKVADGKLARLEALAGRNGQSPSLHEYLRARTASPPA